MKRFISFLLVSLVLFSLTGCEEAVNTLQTQASEAVDAAVDSAVDQGKEMLSNWWGDLIGCDHTPAKYKKDKGSVFCVCGANEFRDLSYEVFVSCIPRGLVYPDSWWRDEEKYANREYAKYYAENNGVDPAMMEFVVSLNIYALSDAQKNQLSGLAGSVSDIFGTIESASNFDDAILDGELNLADDFFQETANYFGAASTTLHLMKTAVDLNILSNLQNSSADKTETFHALIEVIKDGTSQLPAVYSNYFDQALSAVEEGFAVLAKGSEYDLVYKTVMDSVAEDLDRSIFIDTPWRYLEAKRTWEQGPSLTEIAAADLSPEMLVGIAPYIEYRINLELGIITGSDMGQIIENYKN